MDPKRWQHRSPGDLADLLPEVSRTEVEPAIARSAAAWREWSHLSLEERMEALTGCRKAIEEGKDLLARMIARETGKPIAEARGELAAVVAKFDLAFADAREFLETRVVSDGPHPAEVRRLSRGPAAVIAPFNFPIHLGHGAAVGYLLAGNTVLFKPSPFAAVTASLYASAMQAALPEGTFELVQGWSETAMHVMKDDRVRSVCFTGSVAAGRAIARELATDFSKSLALELGGKNASIICADADLQAAAAAVAESLCLGCGQRCNATSRILIEHGIADQFLSLLVESFTRYAPGDPLDDSTRLGPLISEKAVDRYRLALADGSAEWLAKGRVTGHAAGKRGYYVEPALAVAMGGPSRLENEELFAPIGVARSFLSDEEAAGLAEASPFGLSAAVFTTSRERFESIGRKLRAGNLYWNVPTTFSPSTLPFGGLKDSGNGKPGGRGFARFCADDQAVQLSEPQAKTLPDNA